MGHDGMERMGCHAMGSHACVLSGPAGGEVFFFFSFYSSSSFSFSYSLIVTFSLPRTQLSRTLDFFFFVFVSILCRPAHPSCVSSSPAYPSPILGLSCRALISRRLYIYIPFYTNDPASHPPLVSRGISSRLLWVPVRVVWFILVFFFFFF